MRRVGNVTKKREAEIKRKVEGGVGKTGIGEKDRYH